MASSLKRTSEIISVSAQVTESGANTLTATTIQFPLSPLDNEVFVILQVDIDPNAPDLLAGTNTTVTTSLSTTARTTIGTLANTNVVAAAQKRIMAAAGLTCAVAFNDSAPDQTSPNMDYLAILATDDMFLNIQGSNNVAPANAEVRIFGFRAKATSAIYAALVQSELLS